MSAITATTELPQVSNISKCFELVKTTFQKVHDFAIWIFQNIYNAGQSACIYFTHAIGLQHRVTPTNSLSLEEPATPGAAAGPDVPIASDSSTPLSTPVPSPTGFTGSATEQVATD